MGIRYTIDVGARLVRVLYEGEVELKEWTEAMTVLERDPALGARFVILVDRRRAEVPSLAFVRGVVEFLNLHAGRFGFVGWATLVDGTASYGMSRMAQTLLGDLPFPLEIFMDETAALLWLYRILG